jgi:hypothetical protein
LVISTSLWTVAFSFGARPSEEVVGISRTAHKLFIINALTGACHPQFLARSKKWHPGRAKPFYKRITDLSCFMHDLKWRISWEINRANDAKGHVWDGRFRSIEVKGKRQMSVTDTYIQLNPSKAGMVEKPSQYPHCTTRIKAAMDKDIEIEAPMHEPFASIKDNLSRCKAYVAYQDWMAHLLKNPAARHKRPPPEVIALDIPEENWEETCLEIEKRAPVDWWSQVYGDKPKKKQIRPKPKDPPRFRLNAEPATQLNQPTPTTLAAVCLNSATFGYRDRDSNSLQTTIREVLPGSFWCPPQRTCVRDFEIRL